MYRLSSVISAIWSMCRCFLKIFVFHLIVSIPRSAVIRLIRAPKFRVRKMMAARIKTTTSIQKMAVLGLWTKSCIPTPSSVSPPRNRKTYSWALSLSTSWFIRAELISTIKVNKTGNNAKIAGVMKVLRSSSFRIREKFCEENQ